GDVGHQVVVDPQAAHRVVGGGVDAHRHFVGVLVGDPLVHLEQVPVAVGDDVGPHPLDRGAEVEVDAVVEGADPLAGLDHAHGGPGGDVAGDQVAEGGIHPLQGVVAILLRDLARGPVVVGSLRDPDARVVTQRHRHEGQVGLGLVRRGDAGGVDLGVAGVGEGRSRAVGAPGGGDVAAHGVGGEVGHVGVAAGGQYHRVGGVAL